MSLTHEVKIIAPDLMIIMEHSEHCTQIRCALNLKDGIQDQMYLQTGMYLVDLAPMYTKPTDGSSLLFHRASPVHPADREIDMILIDRAAAWKKANADG